MKSLAFLLLLLVGCAAHIPTKNEIDLADCGAFPKEHEQLVKDYIKENFVDPESVRDLTILAPVKAYFSLGKTVGLTSNYGYEIAFECNAKNNYGGYNGKDWTFLLCRDGKLWDVTKVHKYVFTYR